MTARKPLVPPELRELLTLLPDLDQVLPYPADGQPEAWDRRAEVKLVRQSLLRHRLTSLADEFKFGDQFPARAAEALAAHCRHAIKTVRECLAEPLGYEVEGSTDERT